MNRRLSWSISNIFSLDAVILVVTAVVVAQTEAPTVTASLDATLGVLPLVSPARAAQFPTFLLLFLLVYSLLPVVYPRWLGHPIRTSTWTRLAVAGFGFGMAQQLYLVPNRFSLETGPLFTMMDPLSLFTYAVTGALVVSFSYRNTEHGFSLSSESALLQPILRYSTSDGDEWDDDIDRLRQSYPRYYIVQKYGTVIAIGLLSILPALVLGMLVGAISLFYPVLEIVAVIRVVLHRIPTDNLTAQSERLPQIEDSFYDQLTLLGTFVGVGALLPIVTGLGILGVVFVAAAGLIDFIPWNEVGWAFATVLKSPSVSSVGYVLDIGIAIGSHNAAALTPVVMALYGLWFLSRACRRLPGLLTVYVDDRMPDTALSSQTELPRRPRGFLLPLIPLGILHANHAAAANHYLTLSLDGLVFLLPWLLVVGVMLVTVVESRTPSTIDSIRSVQIELFAPFLSIMAAGFVLVPDKMLLGKGIAVYLLCNVLFYKPDHGVERSVLVRWGGISAGVLFIGGILGGLGVPWALGLAVFSAVAVFSVHWLAPDFN